MAILFQCDDCGAISSEKYSSWRVELVCSSEAKCFPLLASTDPISRYVHDRDDGFRENKLRFETQLCPDCSQRFLDDISIRLGKKASPVDG